MNNYFYAVDFTCPEDFYPSKKQEFRLSRFSLSNLTMTHLGSSQLEIEDFDHLSFNHDFKVSLSHTKDAGCAVISNSPTTLGIGIDIEDKNRKYRSGIEKFYILPNEDDKNLNKLQLWCAKEAAYKAYYYQYLQTHSTKPLVLKDFVIKDGQFFAFGDLLGSIDFYEHDNYLVSVAVLKNKGSI